MNSLTLKDEFKIDDNHSKVRGVVVLSDKNNNVIFKRENMIVLSGRKWIMSNGATGWSKLKFGSNGEMTSPENTDIKKDIGLEFNFSDTTVTASTVSTMNPNNRYYPKDDNTTLATEIKAGTEYYEIKPTQFNKVLLIPEGDQPILHFKLIVKTTDNIITSQSREMALFVNNGNTMFSRVVFEPVSIATHNNDEYCVDYFIYF